MLSIKPMKSYGFTLIELLVTVVIISVLTTSAVAGYITFQKNQQLEQEGSKLLSDLRMAQKKAMVGDKPNKDGCAFSTSLLSYYEISATANTLTYTIHAKCASGNPAQVSSYTIPSNDGISITSGFTIQFFGVDANGVYRGTVVSPSAPATESVTITLTQGSTGNTYQIKVTKGGSIEKI